MFRIGGGKTMCAIEIRICAEEQIIISVRMKHGLNAGFGRDINRSGRKPGILIGIVWRIDGKMLLEDAV